jgi:hypothetical protein
MEFFALGHEYGHIIYNHLDNAFSQKLSINDFEVDEINLMWKQEIEADILGLDLSILWMKKMYTDPVTWTSGPYVFLKVLELIEDLTKIFKPNQQNTTHPPAHLRIKFLKEYIDKTAPSELKPRILNALDNYDLLMDIYKNMLSPLLLKEKESGTILQRKSFVSSGQEMPNNLYIIDNFDYNNHGNIWK